MAFTVNSAFADFNREYVNLDPNRTIIANSSRDWLISQLENLPNKLDNFPKLYNERHIKFGYFARKTKIRPLNDIDLILAFHAQGTTYYTYQYGRNYSLHVSDDASNLIKLCNEDQTLNSIKLVNLIVSSLYEIEHYKNATIHRRQEAATLQLKSYEWNFDIVPAFYTDTGYYLIPDGSGGWKASDPRIDQYHVTDINQNNDGNVLQLIRTLKYWNIQKNKPSIPSYLFENIILNYVESNNNLNQFIDINLNNFWNYLITAIYWIVNDPKNFQDDLNNLTYDEKLKVSNNAKDSCEKGREAYIFETEEKNQEKAINKWRQIFGDNFPKYG